MHFTLALFSRRKRAFLNLAHRIYENIHWILVKTDNYHLRVQITMLIQIEVLRWINLRIIYAVNSLSSKWLYLTRTTMKLILIIKLFSFAWLLSSIMALFSTLLFSDFVNSSYLPTPMLSTMVRLIECLFSSVVSLSFTPLYVSVFNFAHAHFSTHQYVMQ